MNFEECYNQKCTFQHLQGTNRRRHKNSSFRTQHFQPKMFQNEERRQMTRHPTSNLSSGNREPFFSPKWLRKAPETPESGVENAFAELQKSINELHLQNSFIRSKLHLLESNQLCTSREQTAPDMGAHVEYQSTNKIPNEMRPRKDCYEQNFYNNTFPKNLQ